MLGNISVVGSAFGVSFCRYLSSVHLKFLSVVIYWWFKANKFVFYILLFVCSHSNSPHTVWRSGVRANVHEKSVRKCRCNGAQCALIWNILGEACVLRCAESCILQKLPVSSPVVRLFVGSFQRCCGLLEQKLQVELVGRTARGCWCWCWCVHRLKCCYIWA